MRKFFAEFKKFITRGNVLDMAVGVIVGGAFTGIVNGISNYVLKPIINWIIALVLDKDGLKGAITMLSPEYKLADKLDPVTGKAIIDPVTGEPVQEMVYDLANSIYIDWGSLISAIINFFLIALVLFCIVRAFNKVRENNQKVKASLSEGKLTKEEKKAIKAEGINPRDKEAVNAYLAKKAEQEAKAKAEAEEKARLEREANPTTEDLLKKILAVMEAK